MAIWMNAAVEDVYALDFDRGDFVIDAYGEDVYVGDGIPDAAQFALLLLGAYWKP